MSLADRPFLFGKRDREGVIIFNDAFYKVLFDSSDDAMFIAEVTREGTFGGFLAVNDAACHRLGYSREELLGLAMEDVEVRLTSQELAERVVRLFSAGSVRLDTLYRRKDGVLLAVELSLSLVEAQGRLLLLTAARYAATGRENEASIRRRNEYLAALYEIAKAIMNEMDLDELLTKIVTQLTRLLDAPHGFVFLVTADGKALECRVNNYYRNMTGLRLAPGEGLAGMVWASGKFMAVDDYAVWPGRLPGADWNDAYRVVAAPLMSGGKTNGVIGVDYTARQQEVNPAEQEYMLTMFAELAAVAIENANLHSGLQAELARRRELEAALEKYRLFFNHSQDIMLFVQDDGRIVEANTAAEAAYGYSRTELLGMKVQELRAEMTLGEVRGQLDAAADAGIMFQTMHRRKDGSVFPVEVNSRGAEVGGERLLLSVVRDISERTAVLRALLEQKHFSESLIQNSAIPTYVIDKNHKVIVWNKACEKLTGARATDIVGTDGHRRAWHHSARPALVDRVVAGDMTAAPYYSVYEDSELVPGGRHAEIWVTTGQGLARYLIADAAPIYDSNGELVAGIQMVQDRTESMRAEEALRRDIALAGKIQQGFLPADLETERLTVRTIFCPYNSVSGDLFDYRWDGKEISGVVLDVMGHSLAAALQTSALKVMFRQAMESRLQPVEMMHWVNSQSLPYFTDDMFAAAIYFRLDCRSRELSYVAAGINSFLVAAGGETRMVKAPGSLLGVSAVGEFNEHRMLLTAGTNLCFGTDGLFDLLPPAPALTDFTSDVAELRALCRDRRRRDDVAALCLALR